MAKKVKAPSWLLAGSAVIAAWGIYSALLTEHNMPIGSAIDAERKEFYGKNSALMSYYSRADKNGRPLILIHSINAAANSYEMRPLFNHYATQRPVFALDLPGFGFSGRTNRNYSVDLYVAAITDFLEDIVSEAVDVIALSLSSEFAAIVAKQSPDLIHSLTCISPTGFSPQTSQIQQNPILYDMLSNSIWSQAIYDLLVSKPSLGYFLGMSFSGDIDAGLLDYHYRSAHQLGARYAPLSFISGNLFTPNIFEDAYKSLTLPTMLIYDTDPNTSFERLPDLLNSNPNWRARRILNTNGLPQFERPDMTINTLDIFWDDILG